MVQTVQGQDGTVHNFPDEATPEMISGALGLKPPVAQNFFQNFAAGAEQNLEKTGAGLLGLGTDALQGLGVFSPNEASSYKNQLTNVSHGAEQQFPADSGIGHFLGTNTAGAPMAFLPGLGPIGAGTVGGAFNSIANTNPNASLGMKTSNAVIDSGVGALTGKVVGSILGKTGSNLSAEDQRLAQVASDQGIDLTPAQQTGNKTLNLFEKIIGSQDQQAPRQAEQFTQAAMRNAGSISSDASPQAVDKALTTSGEAIGNIAGKYSLPVDDQFINDLIAASDKHSDIIEPLQKPIFDKIINTLSSGDEIPGDVYKSTRTQLGKIAKTSWNSNPQYAQAVSDVQDALDNAMQRVMSPEDSTAMNLVRQQYGSAKTIARAMRSGTDEALSGNIPPNRLLNAQFAQGDNFSRGRGALNDVSRAGARFITDGDSASTTGDAVKGIARSLAPAAFVGGTDYALNPKHDATRSLELGAAALSAPLLARLLYNTLSPMIVNGVPGLNNPAAIHGMSGTVGNYLTNLIASQSNAR